MVSKLSFNRQSQFNRAARVRAGFTLIELLVVVGLILLIAVMTASAINTTISGDKVRGGARQVQSLLAGARDRAIYSKAPRGVRFLLDSTNNRTVSSMVYIAPTDDWTQGTIQMEWYGGVVKAVRAFDNTATSANSLVFPTGWLNLYNQGLLKNGVRIKIPDNNTGEWYTVDTSQLANASPDGSGGPVPPRLLLLTKLSISPTQTASQSDGDPAFQPGTGPTTYRLELPPGVLPNQEPVLLPKGCVIHLDRCTTAGNLENLANHGDKLPSSWKKATTTADPSGFDYSSMMDVMFSPRGVVIGPAAQSGIIHLYLGEQKDADLDRTYWTTTTPPTNSAPEYGFWTDPTAISPNYERGDKIVLTIFTRTGAVSTHPIHPTDRFKFAETGEVAGK